MSSPDTFSRSPLSAPPRARASCCRPRGTRQSSVSWLPRPRSIRWLEELSLDVLVLQINLICYRGLRSPSTEICPWPYDWTWQISCLSSPRWRCGRTLTSPTGVHLRRPFSRSSVTFRREGNRKGGYVDCFPCLFLWLSTLEWNNSTTCRIVLASPFDMDIGR